MLVFRSYSWNPCQDVPWPHLPATPHSRLSDPARSRQLMTLHPRRLCSRDTRTILFPCPPLPICVPSLTWTQGTQIVDVSSLFGLLSVPRKHQLQAG